MTKLALVLFISFFSLYSMAAETSDSCQSTCVIQLNAIDQLKPDLDSMLGWTRSNAREGVVRIGVTSSHLEVKVEVFNLMVGELNSWKGSTRGDAVDKIAELAMSSNSIELKEAAIAVLNDVKTNEMNGSIRASAGKAIVDIATSN